ncbi:hypothetical protein swp_0959 [Shewanella piezotolerans WP3]|uniref:Uncharacterized protein n=1 Tax=Shewanella piezotolerans (strain WP3 / JCM 13877) TaxID=225849 RepID=B8CK60_SHEPW|nr:hypothetical protein swp_0959 [Shewanella piezotolerans WP3]
MPLYILGQVINIWLLFSTVNSHKGLMDFNLGHHKVLFVATAYFVVEN